MRGGASSPAVPLAYLVAAAAAFVIATAGVVALAPALAGHYYQPRVLALAHTVTLGWITLTIIGATYQLLPVVLERPLASERVAWWQLALLAAGIVGLVGHFWIGHGSGLAWAAGLVAAGALAHVVNLACTMRGLARWSFTTRLMALALVGLTTTALFGFLLAADRGGRILPGDHFGKLHAHVHLALLGWVLPMLMGVTARVYPMFLLAHEPHGPLGTVQLVALGAGVPFVVGGLLGGSAFALASGTLAVSVAVAAHLAWIARIVRTRRRPIDTGVRFALTGTACLAPTTLVGTAMALGLVEGPRVAIAYVVLGLGGAASLTIVGMMLKIVPFLVWYRTYGPLAGRGRVPGLADLSSPRVDAVAYPALVTGIVLLAASTAFGAPVAIRISAVVLACGVGCFALSLGRVLAHLRGGAFVARSSAPPVERSSPA